MHFFNPRAGDAAGRVIAGDAPTNGPWASRARRGGRWQARDRGGRRAGVPRQRCGRPFGLEALRLLGERIATVERIDASAGSAALPHGPLRVDGPRRRRCRVRRVPLVLRVVIRRAALAAVHDPRGWWPLGAWAQGRPRLLRLPLRAASARGPPTPPPVGGAMAARSWSPGRACWRTSCAPRRGRAGYLVAARQDAGEEPPWLILDCGAEPDDPPLQGAPQAILCAEGSLAALDPGGAAAGFHALPPRSPCGLVRADARPRDGRRRDRAHRAAVHGPRQAHRMGRGRAGAGARRIVCQLINEAPSRCEGVGRRRRTSTRACCWGFNYHMGPCTGRTPSPGPRARRARRAGRRVPRGALPRAPLPPSSRLAGRSARTGAGFFEHDS